VLALTKKTGYGIIAMSDLAGLDGEKLHSAREIAERFDLPTSLMMNVLKELAAKGYVESVRGARGGYRLACDPRSVSLAELITALEGPIQLAECILPAGRRGKDGICRMVDRCPIADPVHHIHRKLVDFLKTLTLAEVVQSVPAGAK